MLRVRSDPAELKVKNEEKLGALKVYNKFKNLWAVLPGSWDENWTKEGAIQALKKYKKGVEVKIQKTVPFYMITLKANMFRPQKGLSSSGHIWSKQTQ